MCLLRFLPECVHALLNALLLGVVLRLPELRALDFIGKILLVHEVSLIVMGVLVVIAVTQFFHERCGGVPKMQRDR